MSKPDRVLEIGNYAAGYAGRLFAHMGCEVTRVEPADRKACWVSEQAMDLYLHTNKRRVQTSNKELIAELAKAADVVILDAESANQVENSGFHEWECDVKVAITPFGLTGPDRNRAATNATILALGGYTNLMGDQDRDPLTAPGHYVDFQSGGYAFTAASSCLLADETNVIDIGMLEVIMSLSQFTTVMWTCANRVRSRHGNDFWWVVPTCMFQCQDGWVYINVVPHFWDPFTTFLEMPELTLDERFTTNTLRMVNRDALHDIIDTVFSRWTRREIQKRAEIARIPVGAVLTFSEVLNDPHLRYRQIWQEMKLQDNNNVLSPRPAFTMAGLEAIQPKLNSVEHLRYG